MGMNISLLLINNHHCPASQVDWEWCFHFSYLGEWPSGQESVFLTATNHCSMLRYLQCGHSPVQSAMVTELHWIKLGAQTLWKAPWCKNGTMRNAVIVCFILTLFCYLCPFLEFWILPEPLDAKQHALHRYKGKTYFGSHVQKIPLTALKITPFTMFVNWWDVNEAWNEAVVIVCGTKRKLENENGKIKSLNGSTKACLVDWWMGLIF